MPIAIFDLDGTLANNDDLAVRAALDGLRRYYESRGEEPVIPSPEKILSLVGMPARDYFAAMLPENLHHDLPEFMEMVQQCEYDRLCDGEGSLYPGADRVVEGMLNDGWRLGLASNCMRLYLDGNLDHVVKRDWFEIALCLDDRSSKRENVRDALEFLGGGKGFMIGDRLSDMNAGKANGLMTIGCSYGHGGPDEIRDADRTIDDINRLPAVLAELSSADDTI